MAVNVMDKQAPVRGSAAAIAMGIPFRQLHEHDSRVPRPTAPPPPLASRQPRGLAVRPGRGVAVLCVNSVQFNGCRLVATLLGSARYVKELLLLFISNLKIRNMQIFLCFFIGFVFRQTLAACFCFGFFRGISKSRKN